MVVVTAEAVEVISMEASPKLVRPVVGCGDGQGGSLDESSSASLPKLFCRENFDVEVRIL